MMAYDRTLRELALLVMSTSLVACGSAPTKDYAPTVATHTKQIVDSPMPTQPITASDNNITVTVRVVAPGEPGFLVENGVCHQIDVQALNKSANDIELGGNDASVGGVHVPVLCPRDSLIDVPTDITFVKAVGMELSGSLNKKMATADAIEKTTINNRILPGSATTQGFDYVPKDRIYEGFYFVYKMKGEIHKFPITFPSSVPAKATQSPQ